MIKIFENANSYDSEGFLIQYLPNPFTSSVWHIMLEVQHHDLRVSRISLTCLIFNDVTQLASLQNISCKTCFQISNWTSTKINLNRIPRDPWKQII